jgi:putative flavoprotein involved in K+ transport
VTGTERFDTVVVGAGQAGLATGYHLARHGVEFVILDAGQRVGDRWRKRWNSLRLFTPARYSGLPGWGFPAPAWSWPGKDDVADYLRAYAARFDLPVRTGVRVDGLVKDGDWYVLTAGEQRIVTSNVVLATGAYDCPNVPAFATELDPGILQLHSSEYVDPAQLRDGPALVVGAGNSGAEIAFEIAATRPTWLSGRDAGHLLIHTGSGWDRLLTPPFWFMLSRLLTVDTPIGRRARPKLMSGSTPLERVHPKDLASVGVERVPRTIGVHSGAPVVEGDRVIDAVNVIWCTGFRPDFGWIDLPILGADGQPAHDRGVITSSPGMYVVGLRFLYSLASSLIGGVGRDADHIARHIASREHRMAPGVPAARDDA